jgi:hydrogenase expression/formation protein HypC
MCLAVPGRLIEVKGDEALASLHGNKLRISTALIPGAQPGDWVLIHAGFAIQKLEGTELEQTWAILQDIADCQLPIAVCEAAGAVSNPQNAIRKPQSSREVSR